MFCVLLLFVFRMIVLSHADPTFTTKPDTWAAVDALGRVLPTHDQVGDLKPDKFVGIFYFLWAENEAGFKTGPYDNTQIMAKAGGNLLNATFGPLYAFHHWGRPYFDYYLIDDDFVIRKHAQMLADAGVDTLILDATNAITYDNIWSKIGAIYTDMRSKSIRTPKFCFITWSKSPETVQKIYDNLYSQNLFKDLWFMWDGKPLIFANPDGLPAVLSNFFTVRESWAWTKGQAWYGDGRGKWPWIDNYPQGPGLALDGHLEQTCVTVAGHPIDNIGRSFDGPTHHEPDQINPAVGTYFSQQWEHALQTNPPFIFVTGWNEWIAQRFVQTTGDIPFIGKHWPVGTTFFVDEFLEEYSRDIEPMSGGHGDNYYYQLISFIRRFKGMSPPETPSPMKTIQINQDFTQWTGVAPFYLDDLYDIPSRNHSRYGDQGGQLIDTSQRNDLAVFQIARDQTNVYFYARSTVPWVQGNNFTWLLLNTDNDYSTGWIGFDYLVDIGQGQLKKSSGSPGQWQPQQSVAIVNSGNNELHFALAYQSINLNNTQINLQFKWLSADVLYTNDPLNFIDKGDAAPNGRFTYTYMVRNTD